MPECSWNNIGLTIAALTTSVGSMLCVLAIYCMLRAQIKDLTKKVDDMQSEDSNNLLMRRM